MRHFLNLTLDDTSISVLEYGEKLAFVEAGYMPPETRRDLSIIGDLGSLYCNFQKNFLSFFENRHEKQGERWVALEGNARQISLDAGEPLKLELARSLDSIRNRSKPLADGRVGLEALRIVRPVTTPRRKGEEWRSIGVKLPGHRPGLPGKVFILYCAP